MGRGFDSRLEYKKRLPVKGAFFVGENYFLNILFSVARR